MGDSQKVPYDVLLREARERFDAATDLTVSVEEEFALLDPSTLDLVNRFEDVQAAAAETPLITQSRRRADRIRGGDQDGSAGDRSSMRLRRFPSDAPSSSPSSSHSASTLGATGSHPWASWKDQRIIDTPHYRRNDEILRYVVWKNTTFGLHVHVGVRGADRAIAAVNGVRNWLPELLALSASSPFAEGVNTGLHSARTQIFTRFFPRCGVPDTFSRLGRVRAIRPLPLRDAVDRRAHPAVVEHPAALRVSDRRDPDLRRAARHRGGPVARRSASRH